MPENNDQPLGLWFKPLWKVEVMPSVVDPRKFIEVHADEDWMAIDAAECAGYRAYSAQPAQQPTNYVFTTGAVDFLKPEANGRRFWPIEAA